MIDGQHHTVSPQYLHQYATHAAWLEDNRRLDMALCQIVRSAWRSNIQYRGSGRVIGSDALPKGFFVYCSNLQAIFGTCLSDVVT